MFDTHDCDYLKHSTFRFNLNDFQLNTDLKASSCELMRLSFHKFVTMKLILRSRIKLSKFEENKGSLPHFKNLTT